MANTAHFSRDNTNVRIICKGVEMFVANTARVFSASESFQLIKIHRGKESRGKESQGEKSRGERVPGGKSHGGKKSGWKNSGG